jgi:hypothetical protein
MPLMLEIHFSRSVTTMKVKEKHQLIQSKITAQQTNRIYN